MTSVSPAPSVLFFGEDAFSLAVFRSLIEGRVALRPLAVIMLEPISVSGGRLVDFCKRREISVIKTRSVRSEEFLARFDSTEYDLVICAHFERILPARLFRRARIGALNLHPSLLPKYRGMAPQHWPIIMGEAETGVTVHRIDEGVDTGRIMRQIRIPLGADTYIYELQAKFLSVYREIMVEAVERLLAGEEGDEQPVYGGSYFQKLKEADMEIQPWFEAHKAYSYVRAFAFPYRGARFGNIRIIKAKPVATEFWRQLKRSENTLGLHELGSSRFLMLKDGALEIIKWKGI